MLNTVSAAEILSRVLESDLRGFELRKFAMGLLSELEGYNWCGVYAWDEAERELVLDAFVGAPTEHERINVGVGVCGTAVAEDRNVVVEDVRHVDNYLACSVDTRSEIVVLIKSGPTLLGQIDIDGHRAGQFGAEDERFLAQLAELLADRWVSCVVGRKNETL